MTRANVISTSRLCSLIERSARKTTHPATPPKITPPMAWVAKSSTTSRAEISCVPDTSPRRMENTTTPTPSLKRLSPATVASRTAGTLTDFRMPSTATGSVGLISAPKSRHHTQRQVDSEQGRQQPRTAADEGGGQQDSEHRNGADRPFRPPHLVQVDMESTGEQQKGQHAFHQGEAKIDACDQCPDRMAMLDARYGVVDRDEHERRRGAHDGKARGLGQAHEAMIDISQQGGEDDQRRRDVERSDRGKHAGSLHASAL